MKRYYYDERYIVFKDNGYYVLKDNKAKKDKKFQYIGKLIDYIKLQSILLEKIHLGAIQKQEKEALLEKLAKNH